MSMGVGPVLERNHMIVGVCGDMKLLSKPLKSVSLYLKWEGLPQPERVVVRSQNGTSGHLAYSR